MYTNVDLLILQQTAHTVDGGMTQVCTKNLSYQLKQHNSECIGLRNMQILYTAITRNYKHAYDSQLSAVFTIPSTPPL